MVEIIINDKDRESKKETIIINPQEKQAVVIEAPKKNRPAKKTVKNIKKKDAIIIESEKNKPAKKARNSVVQKTTINEMTKVLKANQELVDEMIKVNTIIMENVLKLSVSVASLTEKMTTFLIK